MPIEKKGFDANLFYTALGSTVAARGANWKRVSEETGVSQTTLSRMARGRQPDASSLTALAAWAGLNPTDFFSGAKQPAEPFAMATKLLRQDPNLDEHGAEALEEIMRAAYERFKRARQQN